MHKLTKTKLPFMFILLFGLYNEPANSILSENTPKNNQISPIYNEKTVSEPASPKTKASVQMPEEKKSRNQTERIKEKQVKQKDIKTEITITAKRIEKEIVPVEKPKTLFSDVVDSLENIINEKDSYQFLPSVPENDFLILSALDVVITNTENSLYGGGSKIVDVKEQPACQAELNICNNLLISSLSERLENIEFIKLSQQALGTQVYTPDISLLSPFYLTESDIKFAFLASKEAENKKNKDEVKPEDFSYLIRNILKNKETFFTNPDNGFINKFRILQTELSTHDHPNSGFFQIDMKPNSHKQESNLNADITKQAITQINEFINFLEQKKIVVENQIIIADKNDTPTITQILDLLEQETSITTSLFNLMSDYIENDFKDLQNGEAIKKNTIAWYQNYTKLLEQMDGLPILSDEVSENNLILISDLQTQIRNARQNGIALIDTILNSKEGIVLFDQSLPEISLLNAELKEVQETLPYRDLDIIMQETTEKLNQILNILTSENIDQLSKPINKNTLEFFPGFVHENRAMQEIIDFILFKNHQLNNSQDISLSDIGVYTDKDGFFKYKAGYLKLNSSSPEKQAIKILDNLNYISKISTF